MLRILSILLICAGIFASPASAAQRLPEGVVAKQVGGLDIARQSVRYPKLAQCTMPLCGAGLGAPGGTSFSGPSSFGANLIAYWDPGLQLYTNGGCTSVTGNGGVVECQKDQSGNGFSLQSNVNCTGVGVQATLNTTGINSQPSITLVSASVTGMDGKSNGASCLGNGFDWGAGSPQFTVWLIMRFTSSTGTSSSFAAWQNGGGGGTRTSTDGIEFFSMNGNVTHIGPSWDANDWTQDHVVAAATTYCLSATFDGTTLTTYVNNADAVAHTAAVALSQKPLQYFLGTTPSGNDATHAVDGQLGPVVMINKFPSSTDRSNMQTWQSSTKGYGC